MGGEWGGVVYVRIGHYGACVYVCMGLVGMVYTVEPLY